MAVENAVNPLALGTELGALMIRNQGNGIAVTTAVGELSGTLESYHSSYLRIADSSGTLKYVLCNQIIAVSFSNPPV